MGCGSLTPAAATAMAGMLQGRGLSIPMALTAAITSYTTRGTVGAAQSAMRASSKVLGNPLAGLGANIFPAMTGVVPTPLTPMMSSNNLNNFGGQVGKQASQTMSGGIGGFAQILSQSNGFASNSLSTKKFMATASNIPFNKLGLGITNSSQLASNGFGSISNDMPKLASVIGRLGKLYDARNPRKLGTAGNMAKNIIERNLGKIGDLIGKLEDRGIPLDDLENLTYEPEIRQVLGEVEVADVQTIYGSLGVDMPNSMKLTDAMDIHKLDIVANVSAISSDVRSLQQLGIRLDEMGASFEDATEFADTVRTIEIVNAPRLDAYCGSTLVTDGDRKSSDEQLGRGSGPMNNPNIEDLMGSVGGMVHTDSLMNMTTPMATISSSSNGILFNKQMNLMEQVANGNFGGGGNAILDQADPSRYANIVVIDSGNLTNAGMGSLTITGNISVTLAQMRPFAETTLMNIKADPALAPAVNTATLHYHNSTTQLAREKFNLAVAGIDISQPAGSAPTNARADDSYPNAPLTNWSATDLIRYWKSLPLVNTGTVSTLPLSELIIEKPDLCRGAMLMAAHNFANSAVFVGEIESYLASGADPIFPTANLATWSRSLYPDVTEVTFDYSTGICYYNKSQWRTDGLSEERPIGYPIDGVPKAAVPPNDPGDFNPPAEQPQSVTRSAAGDKSSIINFASQLGEMGKDENGFGLSDLITNMSTNDAYGDAIRVAMIEGRNKARLEKLGIKPITDRIN